MAPNLGIPELAQNTTRQQILNAKNILFILEGTNGNLPLDWAKTAAGVSVGVIFKEIKEKSRLG